MSPKLLFWMIATILIISFVNAETISRANGNIALQFTTNDYYNTTIVPKTYLTYEYGNENPSYSAYFDNTSNQGDTVKFIKNNYSLNFFPMQLNYMNNLGSVQMIIATQTVTGSPNGSNFNYKNIYGSGIDLVYKSEPTRLKEELVINSKSNIGTPSASILSGGNPVLVTQFQISFDTGIGLYIEGALWDKTSDKTTSNTVEVKETSTGKTLYKLMKPIAVDSNGNTQPLSYLFKKTANKLIVQINTPFSWLNNTAVYPVRIDPTIIIIDEVNATIIISPETNECYGHDCGSTIEIQNTGLTNVSFNTSDLSVSIEGSESNKLYFYDETLGNDVLANLGRNITLIPSQEFQFDIFSHQISEGTWKYNVSFNYFNHTYLVDPYYITGNSTPESTTTTVTPLNKTILNISVSSTKPYAILVNSEVSGDSLTSNSLTDLFLDSVSVSQQSEESKDSDPLNYYPSKAMLWVGNLSAGTHTAITTYQSQTSGVITRIRNSYITAIELPIGSETSSNIANVSYTTSLVSRLNKPFNVATEGNYWIFGSAVSDTDGTATVDLRVDNLNYINSVWSPKDVRDYTGFLGQKIINLSSGSHSMSIFASSTTTGADWIRDMYLMAVPLSNSYYWFNETTTETSTGSATFVNSTNLTFNVTNSGDYLIIATGIFGSNSATKSAEVTLIVDGTNYCDIIRETLALSNRYPFMCQKSLNLSSGIHTANIQYREVQSGTAYIKETSLLVISKNEKICSPRLNEDWVINDAQVCDNKIVTTGTGKINITSTGSLELKNNADVTTSAISPFPHPTASFWRILIERGSKLNPR